MTLGNRIAEARDAAELSQGKLATLCGLSGGTALSRYERDQSKPSIDVLAAIADHTGKSTDWLLGREKPEQPTYRGLSRQTLEAAKDLQSLPRPLYEHFIGILATLRPVASHAILSKLLSADPNSPDQARINRILEEAQNAYRKTRQ